MSTTQQMGVFQQPVKYKDALQVNTFSQATKQNEALKGKIYFWLAALFLLQIAFVHAFLPIGEWFSPEAIYSDDFSFHYGGALERINYLKHFGKLWGYNPFIRAGSVANAFATIDNNAWGIFCYLLFFLPVEVSFKLFFIIGILIVPGLCYKAARNFELPPASALLSAAIGTLLMHITITVNFLHWGTASFVFVSYTSILAVSYFYKFCLHAGVRFLVFAALSVIVSIWIHAFAIVILSVPLLLCYVVFFTKLNRRDHIYIFVCFLFIVLANLPWMYPFLLFYDQIARQNSGGFYSTRSIMEPIKTYVLRNMIFDTYKNIIFKKDSWVDIILLLSSMPGLYLWYVGKRRKAAIILFGSIVFFFVFSYYGSFFRITNITPMRFLMTLNIFLLFPASAGLVRLYHFFLDDKSSRVKQISKALLLYMLVVLTGPAYYHLFYKKDFRLVYSVPEKFQQIISWINENTSNEGRILIENSDFESGHLYYGSHLPFLLPYWTGREYIGNYSYYAVTKNYIATYNAGILFRKPIGAFSQKELRSYFDLYNIKWVIFWSAESKKVFASGSADYTPMTKIDKFYICRVERKPSFFIKGNGSVKAGYNELLLQGVEDVDDEVILSYHWMKYLKTEPPRKIQRVFLKDDKVGFIKIKNPPSSILIYNSYGD